MLYIIKMADTKVSAIFVACCAPPAAYNIFPARELTVNTTAMYAKAITFVQMLAFIFSILRKMKDKITAAAAIRKKIPPIESVTSYRIFPKGVSGLPDAIPHRAPNADRKR